MHAQAHMRVYAFFSLGLNEHAVEKHLSKSTSTTKGHLNQQRQNTRTTKIKYAQVLDPDPDIDHGIKTQFVYAATIDAGQIYTDQTGRFPVVSSKGNKYIMILYDYDSNAMINYSHSRNPPCAPARTRGQIQAPREPPN
jgi:hypothetical protein